MMVFMGGLQRYKCECKECDCPWFISHVIPSDICESCRNGEHREEK